MAAPVYARDWGRKDIEELILKKSKQMNQR
jgi:hypothetical protein